MKRVTRVSNEPISMAANIELTQIVTRYVNALKSRFFI